MAASNPITAMVASGACINVDRTVKRWNGKTRVWDEVSIFCGKLTCSGSVMCPKHKLMEDEGKAEVSRRMEKLRARKAYKKELRESLSGSPLAAVNPKFEVKSGTYGR